VDIDALKAELADDPLVLGYSSMTDTEAAVSLNMANRTVDVESVTGQQIFGAVVPSHWNALSADYKQLFGVIVGMQTILVNDPNTKLALTTMFAGATATLNALAALQTEQVSRAVELVLGGEVKAGHVEEARR
jgi:hypothetical protein